MSLFGNLKRDDAERPDDSLGGFSARESGIYSGTIANMYAGAAASGARNVTIIFMDEAGKEYRETIYVTNKKGENFYMGGQNKDKKVLLPGFVTVDDICLIATGKGLAEQDSEEKIVKIYDPQEKKELPKNTPVLIETIGKPISLAILKNLENKTVKSGDAYVPDYEADGTPKTRETNSIDKAFDTESHKTVSEALNDREAEFWGKWSERNTGKTRDRLDKSGKAGNAGAPPKAGGAPSSSAAPAKKLFG